MGGKRRLLTGFKAGQKTKFIARGAELTGRRLPGNVVPTLLPNDILDRSMMAAASPSIKVRRQRRLCQAC